MSGNPSDSSLSPPSSSRPQVLTASALPQLTAGFDASDALECYLLVRDAYLHDLANSTIPVRKLALGLRYRPPSSYYGSGKRLELTLEYGPARDGHWLDHEVVPQVVAGPSDGGRRAASESASPPTASSSPPPPSVVWENEARVYYTQRIGGYRTAHYVASMTGAVLKDLLRVAVAYPSRSHRRYQPFSVYYRRPETPQTPSPEGDSSHAAVDRLLLRSSSDLDFVSALWEHLTQVGVELKPVVLPPRWRVRLSAASIRRVHASGMPGSSSSSSSSSSGGTDEIRTISDFYARLYQCVEALATGNYAVYEDTSGSNETHPGRFDEEADIDSNPDEDVGSDSSLEAQPGDGSSNAGVSGAESGVSEGTQDNRGPDDPDSEALPPPPPPATTTTAADTDQVAQDVAKAAQDAETAAQEAQSSGNEQAAQAAQAAADAAKKAADSTRGQAALVAQKALLSGDGAAAAETLSQCLSSPRYGIGRNDSNLTTVYLYWDGNIYYAINLTAPYVQVVAEKSQLPRPPQLDFDSGGGDLVDWSIALAVLALFVCGMLCLLQKVLGRKVQVIRPLYRFQRWFFDPVHYRLDEAALDYSERLDRGQGHIYTFSEDVIPLSMGGRMGWGADTYMAGSHDRRDDDRDGDDGSHSEEVELVASRIRPASGSSGDHDGFYYADGAAEGPRATPTFSRANSPALRFLRNPDFVALPHLKSTSKVAVPVSLHSSHHSRSSLDDNCEDKL